MLSSTWQFYFPSFLNITLDKFRKMEENYLMVADFLKLSKSRKGL